MRVAVTLVVEVGADFLRNASYESPDLAAAVAAEVQTHLETLDGVEAVTVSMADEETRRADGLAH